MRRPFTTKQARANGLSKDALRWAVQTGAIQRIARGVYVKGSQPPSQVEMALAILVLSGGTATRTLAGMLHELDSMTLEPPFVACGAQPRINRPEIEVRAIRPERLTTVRGYQCTDGLRTMIDLAAVVDDLVWEQALESALRKGLTTIAEIENALPELSRARTNGIRRIRRVLAIRPPGAPPTESLLETLAVQLIRSDPSLPTPTRQVEVFNDRGIRVARVDLCYPEHDVFLELDGGWHKGQPKYDAVRQTNVVAAMSWRPGRFNWDEITRFRNQTLQRLRELLAPPKGSINSR